jgi:hypothetical protein
LPDRGGEDGAAECCRVFEGVPQIVSFLLPPRVGARGLKTKVAATADENREGQAVVNTAHPTSVLLGRSAQTLLGDD